MRHVSLLVLSSAALLVPSSCSGSDGGGSGAGFQLSIISLENNEVWKVNQEILFTFSEPVDFSTISLNTITIRTDAGAPATGTFFVPSGIPNQVVFQPTCPLTSLSDTGLQAGGVAYTLTVLGQASGATNVVRSQRGEPLQNTQVRRFTTALQDAEFVDTRPGPPAAIVRPSNSMDQNATHLEVGATGQRVFFERNAMQNIVLDPDGFQAPLNLYGDPDSRISFVIEFDQPIDPSPDNISTNRMRLEYRDGADWFPLDTTVVLEANCTEAGARVRLTPRGPIPAGTSVDPGTGLRAVLFSGILDLVGQSTGTTNDSFAFLETQPIEFDSLTPADRETDELRENFDFAANSPRSLHDDDAPLGVPAARWDDGELTAAFDFFDSGADPCDGGPANSFDWVVSGQIVVDTDGSTIISADGSMVQAIEGSGPRAGMLDVRDMTIQTGAVVRVQGSNPLRINATGTVRIDGLLDVSGFDARDVENLNSGNVTEMGGVGGPGGGRGGDANSVVNASTPRGGTGQGPLGTINGGGQGGETGFVRVQDGKEARRPGGGAGGRFAPELAESGFAGSTLARGAVTNLAPPAGGLVATGPFIDGDPTNNFFGVRPVGTPGNVIDMIRGELSSLWGGFGGGGGGNANPSGVFPTPNWTPSSDEKGGGGGGGGGALHIRALGPILFGPAGQVRANGGRGARGENVFQQDFIGGSGGSGSGGHVVLETASTIASPSVFASGGPRVVGLSTVSAGGAGGPGVIQFNVPNPLGAPPVGGVSSPTPNVLLTSFGARSKARSKWITIGSADKRPGGTLDLVQFVFDGTQPALGADEGKVLDVDQDGTVDELAPIVDEPLATTGAIVNRLTLRLDDAPTLFSGTTGGLSNDLYLRSPSLLSEFTLRLSVGAVERDFLIATASYSDSTAELTLTIVDEGFDLLDFTAANPGPVQVRVIPRFFRVRTCGESDDLPVGSSVRILFQAAADDGSGLPDEDNPLVDWTGDISAFNALQPGDLQFFRFEVEFDLGALTPSSPTISLDFLRIPFLF